MQRTRLMSTNISENNYLETRTVLLYSQHDFLLIDIAII